MTESPFGKVNSMDIRDDYIATPSVNFTGAPLDEFLETHETVLTREEDGYRYNGFLIEDNDYPLQTAELLEDGIRLMNAKGGTLTIEGCAAKHQEEERKIDFLGFDEVISEKQTVIDFQDDMTLTNSVFGGQNRLLSAEPLVIADSGILNSAVRGSTIKDSNVNRSTIKFGSTLDSSTVADCEFSQDSQVVNSECIGCRGFKATLIDGNYKDVCVGHGSLENITNAEDVRVELAGFKNAETLKAIYAGNVGCDVMDLEGGSLEKKNFIGESQDAMIKADWMEVDPSYSLANFWEATGQYDVFLDTYEPTYAEVFKKAKDDGKLTLYKEVEDTGDVVIRRDGVNHYHGFAIENDFWKISRLDKDGKQLLT